MKYSMCFLWLFCAFLYQGCKREPCNISQFNKTINGKKENKFIDFYPDSVIKSILFYRHDTLNDECVSYYNNGRIKNKLNFRNGIQDGISYYFYPSGVMDSYRVWKDGRKVGYGDDYYDTTGEFKAANLYNSEGFLVLRKTFDKQGKLIKEESASGLKQ